MRYPISSLAELGPGNSLGIGLAALLSGVRSYHAFEIERYPIEKTNLVVFDELVSLFKSRSPIPGKEEFPEVKPYISDYSFPHHILTESLLDDSMSDHRLSSIREVLENSRTDDPNSMIRLEVPWTNSSQGKRLPMNMIISQAVLEHIDDLDATYAAMESWLSRDGLMSHQIDFKSHGVSRHWNGHWTIPKWLWKLVRGRRKFLINREPVSTHRRLIDKHGLMITHERAANLPCSFTNRDLAKEFRDLSDSDRTTSSILLQLKRKDDDS
jgi:hypothetical protein